MDWQKTACILCGNLCGLEIGIDNNAINVLRDKAAIGHKMGF
jgi:hypothetical protein